ncbi:DUF5715 family protein [Silvibacterium sp.]|uniref:DUF5715 family protein n=1 Tax=Silvibacterium sp. TaxID=1964179 RepID=UPI0039E54CF3
MRFYFRVTLAALLCSGITFSAYATTTTRRGSAHGHTAHGQKKPAQTASSKTTGQKVSAHKAATPVARRSSRSRASAPVAETVSLHGGRRARQRERLIAAHRRPARIAPVRTEVADAIPAAPLSHWAILPPLVGSHASLVRQNTRTEADGLTRIENDAQLNEMRQQGALVEIPVSMQLRVNEDLPMNRRYCRPWTARFLDDLARAHAARFHRSLQVNSAVRTVEYQRHLQLVNGNAAPAEGDIASPHLTGATIDIAKKGLSTSEVSWMRAYLYPLEEAGKIDVEEEFYQSCFHITVYKSYEPGAAKPGLVPASVLAERLTTNP